MFAHEIELMNVSGAESDFLLSFLNDRTQFVCVGAGFFGLTYDVQRSVAQFACLRDIYGIRAVKLFIEFVVVLSPVDSILDFRAAYRSENLPLK
jgi:hypothetical protein